MSNFKLVDEFFLHYDPMASRKSSKVHVSNHVSVSNNTTDASSTSTSSKHCIRKTGVHLRWYKPDEFHKFSKE